MSTTLSERNESAVQPERTRAGCVYRPNVDILETRDELRLIADVPGARPEDIDVDYERGRLSISARIAPRGAAEADWLLREFGVGDFHREFQIGEGVDARNIRAEVSNGVLTLHLPKTDAAKPRRISVSGG